MDRIDANILKCLTKDARMNASQISQKVNLSVSAVIERMKKMEASGIIRGYTAVIDERLAGYDVQALISIRLEHPKYNQEFNRQMCNHDRVMECFYITGDFDFMLRVVTDNTQSLEHLLNLVKSIPGVQNTRTILILSSVKEEHSVDPDELLK